MWLGVVLLGAVLLGVVSSGVVSLGVVKLVVELTDVEEVVALGVVIGVDVELVGVVIDKIVEDVLLDAKICFQNFGFSLNPRFVTLKNEDLSYCYLSSIIVSISKISTKKFACTYLCNYLVMQWSGLHLYL